jgi:hypothetical protein
VKLCHRWASQALNCSVHEAEAIIVMTGKRSARKGVMATMSLFGMVVLLTLKGIVVNKVG